MSSLVLLVSMALTADHVLPYETAREQGVKRNLPVVVFVGREPHRIQDDHHLVTRADWLKDYGYADKAAVLFVPVNGEMVYSRSFGEAEPVTIVREAPIPDALAEVNAKRARKGLRPLIHDEGLTVAAMRCAQVRAQGLIAGHTANDFSYLPSGAYATSAGCGALEPSWGWETCCYDDPRYTVGGAAFVWGRDGKRYMHIFVR